MTPERWQAVERVYQAARDLNAQRRREFLDEACGGDEVLRKDVESLLEYETAAVRFLEAPALDAASPGRSGAEERPTHPPRHPLRWVVWAATAFTLVSFGVAAYLLTKPVPVYGWSSANRLGTWYVEWVATSGPAAGLLSQGDSLVRLNGDPNVSRAGPGPHLRALSIGDDYRLTVQRDGQEQEYPLTVAAGTRQFRSKVTGFFIPLVWCAIGLFIGFIRPGHAAARLAFAASLATGLLFLHVTIIRTVPPWNPLHVVLGYHFFLLFPSGVSPRGIGRSALFVMYALGGAAVLVRYALWVPELLYGPESVTHFMASFPLAFGALGLVSRLAYGAALVGTVAVIPWNYRRLRDQDDRRRVQWVVLGSAIAVLGQLWWGALILIQFVAGPSSLPRIELSAFSVAIPIVVAYAVVRHRVFDVRVVIRRSLKYVLAKRALQGFIAVPVVVLTVTVVTQRHRTIAELLSDNTAYLFWIGFASLGLALRRTVAVWLDRKFFREQYDSEQVLFGLVDDLGRAESLAEFSRMVSARLEVALHPKALCFWYRDAGDLELDYSSVEIARLAEFPSSGRLLSLLEREPLPLDVSRLSKADVTAKEAEWLADINAALLIPIRDSSARLDGVWLLGERRSETPYSAADHRLLQAIAKQAAVLRENLLLKSQVSEGQRVQLDVLARLDRKSFNLLRECPECGRCFDNTVERCEHDGRPLTASLPVQRTIDGKYRLDRLIGRGGMGAVYEARDYDLDRTVAVKIMMGRSFGSTSALRRFRREARAAASLNHPNIVDVFDFGLLAGEGAYIVMERIRGLTLRARLDRDGTMTPSVAADWFDPLLVGLAAAHARGIVHRDLKPENIIGQERDARLVTVKILDFGLARSRAVEATSDSLTAAGFVVGTLGYISPEQLLGRDADQRSDIFTIGVILAEAMTGRRVFAARTGAGRVRSAIQGLYDLSGSSPESRSLNRIVQRCLAEDPRDRPPSAAILRQDLIPALRRCPPFGPPGSTTPGPDG